MGNCSTVKQSQVQNLSIPKIIAQDLLSDLKVLLKDYFVGDFTEEERSLNLNFCFCNTISKFI